MPELDWSKFPNFVRREFVCRCGCTRADMDDWFMRDLQELRELANFPFIINSGFRCPEHNAIVSTTGRTGPHTTGKAVDIYVFGRNAYKLVNLGMIRFKGVGVRQHGPRESRFVHLDSVSARAAPRPWIWSYS